MGGKGKGRDNRIALQIRRAYEKKVKGRTRLSHRSALLLRHPFVLDSNVGGLAEVSGSYNVVTLLFYVRFRAAGNELVFYD